MGRAMARAPLSHRILTCDDNRQTDQVSCDPAINLSDTVFCFLSEESSEAESSSSSSSSSSDSNYGCTADNEAFDENDDQEKENLVRSSEEDSTFWETQHQQLQGIVCRTSSLETKIRDITKEAVRDSKQSGVNVCGCGRAAAVDNGCRKCLMKEVCSRLRSAGLNSAICKSKWRSNPDIPAGEHTFIDVIDSTNPKKGEVRVIVELNFRQEFEMARASEEYNRLIKRLPEVFVGKVERLVSIIKIVCSAAKKCMRDKRMHMGPWRKQRYMQAKWLKTCERIMAPAPPPSLSAASAGCSGRHAARPRASMLTVDLQLDSLPTSHRTAVAVV